METESSKEPLKESHTIDEDIEKEKMTEEEESNGDTEGNVGEDVTTSTSTSKEKEIVTEPKAAVPDVGKDKSNNSNDTSDGGWKWFDSSKIEDESPVSEVLV